MYNHKIRQIVKEEISKKLLENFSTNSECEDLQESFIGTAKGVGAGILTAVLQMTGGVLTFIGGSPVAGSVIFASSILSAAAVGNLVKNKYEIDVLRKLDSELVENISKRDGLLSAFNQAALVGIGDKSQYEAAVGKLTREQKQIGERLMRHLQSTQKTLEKLIESEVIEKLLTLADLARKGSITKVADVAKYRVRIL